MKKILTATAFGLMMSTASASTTIIGDSHLGGMKPYLQNHMRVLYKNGTTSSYWLKHTGRADTLIIHTGTNEQFNGTSPKKWIENTKSVCRAWGASRCYVVTPPPNRKKNYQAYRSMASTMPHIVTYPSGSTRDGVHYTPASYKQMANQILRYAR